MELRRQNEELFEATRKGDFRKVKYLNFTELFEATRKGDFRKVKELAIRLQYDLRCKDGGGNTLLHTASQKGNVDIFVFLDSHGLDPLATNNAGHTVLHKACIGGNYNMVSYLCQNFPLLLGKRAKGNVTPLHYCCHCSNNIEIFKYLVDQGQDVYTVSEVGDTVLHKACRGARYGMAQYLAQTYKDLKTKVNDRGHTVLHAAAQGGNVELFQWLVQEGCDVNAVTNKGSTVLHMACYKGRRMLTEYLLDKYPHMVDKVDKCKQTALHHAAWGGNVETFKLLLSKGLDVYDLGYQNRTVLHWAAYKGNYDVVQHIVSVCPNLMKMRTSGGETALMLAAEKKNDRVIKYLIEQGMDPSDSIETDRVAVLRKFVESKAKTAVQPSADQEPAVLQESRQAYQFQDRSQTEGEPLQKRLKVQQAPSESSGRFSGTSPSSVESREDSCGESDSEGDLTWSTEITFLSPRLIRMHIKEKGRQSMEIQRLLQWLCSRVESSATGVQYVWPGYMVDDVGEPVFVTIVTEERDDNPKALETFQLVLRKDGQVSDEAKYVVKLEREKNLRFTDGESQKIQTCLTNHTRDLMKKHSNLAIVSASKIKSRKYGTKEASKDEMPCIVFYVHVKGVIPFDEEPFPSELDGFPTDVREGLFCPYSDPREYHQNLMMGCQIGTAYGTCGTLGAFVELPKGNFGCLTCWHVFLTDKSRADFERDPAPPHRHFKRDVFQPAGDFNSKPFGQLVQASIDMGDETNVGVDAALIEITDVRRQPHNGNFPGAVSETAGFSVDNPMVFNTGKVVKGFSEVPRTCSVVKYGCSTGHTRGQLRLAGPAVQKNKFSYTLANNPGNIYELHQQFEIEHMQDELFSGFGDSGSLAFVVKDDGDDYDVTALGLLVGSTTHDTSIVTPIWAVLEKFGLPLQLLPFSAVINPGVQADTSELLRLGVLEHDVTSIKSDMGTLKADVKSLNTSVCNMESSIQTSMKSQFAEMKKFFKSTLMTRKDNKEEKDTDSDDR